MMENSIEVIHVSKYFGQVKALDGINLSATKGDIFGFIGPDGAGKTTLFRILSTLLFPDEGSVIVEGLDVVKEYKKIRRIIGYMPGRFSLYQDLSVEENLEFFATIFGTTIQENYHLVKEIYSQIEPFKKRKAGKLSGGMKQKLALSCALIHKPAVLFLDEPTTGVDAVSRKEFWEMLYRLKNYGISIIVSTPYMDEASRCDRIALIQDGRIMALDTPSGIVSQFERKILALHSKDNYLLQKFLGGFPAVRNIYPSGQQVHLTSADTSLKKEDVLSFLQGTEWESAEVMDITAGIEDCFIELMSKNPGD